ncbi:MAG: YicC family protein [Gammaproteobacteria bacterium]|nr:YicC family protein [Gammaproteobacteria bacterium]
MIYSMTGFARAETENETLKLTWELRSVNHRYLDLSLKLPEALRGLEAATRERIGARLKRGRIEALLRYTIGAGHPEQMQFDEALASRLLDLGQELAGRGSEPLRAGDILRWPGVLAAQELSMDDLREPALAALDQALEELLLARASEGQRLAELIAERIEAAAGLVAEVREFLPEVRTAFRQRLADRLGELREQVDAARIEQEVVVFAQRMDVDEELDRLEAHFQEVGKVLQGDKPVGRRLDFLMQELNREANTLGSKAADLRLTNASVDLKVLIEQMREQVQNIE